MFLICFAHRLLYYIILSEDSVLVELEYSLLFLISLYNCVL